MQRIVNRLVQSHKPGKNVVRENAWFSFRCQAHLGWLIDVSHRGCVICTRVRLLYTKCKRPVIPRSETGYGDACAACDSSNGMLALSNAYTHGAQIR